MGCPILPPETTVPETYAERLREFADTHCEGRELDSCSACKRGMSWGCSHPLHPLNRPDEGRRGAGGTDAA